MGETRTCRVEEVFYIDKLPCVVCYHELDIDKEYKTRMKLSSFPVRWRTGYVGVPKNHPFYKKSYGGGQGEVEELVEIDIHGGLTFSGFTKGFDPKVKDKFPKGFWYLGFDTNHYDDDTKIWTFEFTKKEVIKLAKQLNKKRLLVKSMEK